MAGDIIHQGTLTVAEIRRRVYEGKFDRPKNGKFRDVTIPEVTAAVLQEWMDAAVESEPDAYIFAGEKGKPL